MPYEYITLRRSFMTGTMRAETLATRMLFVTLLFENTHGVVTATPSYLASVAGMSVKAVIAGLERLSRPDPNSSSSAEGGRRIVPIEGRRNTWRIVNWAVYHPALTNPHDDPGGPPRRLPDGRDNPAYWSWIKNRQRQAAKAGAAIEKDLDTMSTTSTMSTSTVDTPSPPVQECIREMADGGQNGGHLQVHNGQNVHHVHLNKRKEKKRKDVREEDPPPKGVPPLGGVLEVTNTRRPVVKGNPANAETWAKFDAAYPTPSNGRALSRTPARLKWDRLADAGEDMDAIIEGARRYSAWIAKMDKGDYVAMMPTWLNQRRWEELHEVDPNAATLRRPPKGETMREELARLTRDLYDAKHA